MRNPQLSGTGTRPTSITFCSSILDRAAPNVGDITLKVNIAAAKKAADAFAVYPAEDLIELAKNRLERTRLSKFFPVVDDRFSAIAVLKGVWNS